MVDFENTHSRGLQGAEYLLQSDSVTIFYSNACMRIEQGRFQQIKESGCSLNICKLQNNGKNALDFYIVSRIGEIYGRDYQGVIAIVSNDTGFQAVRDYWKRCAFCQKNIFVRGNIEQCIISSNENSDRRRKIQQKLQEVDLETEYGKLVEQQKMREALESCFVNTEYESKIEQIMSIIDQDKSLRILYLDSLKQFGKKDGLSIYHTVKQIV